MTGCSTSEVWIKAFKLMFIFIVIAVAVAAATATVQAATVTASFNKTYTVVSGTTQHINLSGLQSISNAYVEFKAAGGSGNFDNSGGGTWQKYAGFMFTSATTEYAQYKVVINGNTLELYNSAGDLKGSGTVTDFWSLIKSDGSDIRVFNQDSQLYFWIESFDYANQQAVIWVKVEAGSTELNIAYGNPSATQSAYNDPRQTFEVYDDFEDGVFDTSYWNKNAIGTVTEANGVIEIQNTDSAQKTIIWSNKYVDYPVIIEAEAKGSSSRMGVALVNPDGDYVILHWLLSGDQNEMGVFKFSNNMQTKLEYNSIAFTTAEGVYHYFRTAMNGHDITGYVKNLNDGRESTVTFTTSASYPAAGYIGLAIRNTVADYRYIRALKLDDPADVSSFNTGVFVSSVQNPKLYLNGNLAASYTGELNETNPSSGKIAISNYWINGNNSLYFTADSGNFDAAISLDYTLNVAETREETFDYLKINTSFYLETGTLSATWQSSFTTSYNYSIKVYVNEIEADYSLSEVINDDGNKTVIISTTINTDGNINVYVFVNFKATTINVKVVDEINSDGVGDVSVRLLDKNFNLITQNTTSADGNAVLNTVFFGDGYLLAKDANGIARQIGIYVPNGGTVNATIYFPIGNVILATFNINDFTGQFKNGDIIIKKYVSRENLITIDQKRITVDYQTSHYLIADEPYQVYVTNGEETRNVGYVSLSTSQTVTLTIESPLSVSPIQYVPVSYNVTSENGTITVQYQTLSGGTSFAEVLIYNSSGALVYYANSSDPKGKFVYLGNPDETYTVEFNAINSIESVSMKVTLVGGGLSVSIDLSKIKAQPEWLRLMFFGGLVVFVSLLFRREHVPVGLMLSFTLTAVLVQLGILPFDSGMLWVLALIVGMAFFVWWRERGVVRQ